MTRDDEQFMKVGREVIRMIHDVVNFMSDEEVALLFNFRRFKAGLSVNKRGTFTFRTWPDERAIVPGDEVSLVEAPEA